MSETADAGSTPATTHGTGSGPGDALAGASSASNASAAAGGPLPAYAEGAMPDEPAGDVPSIQQLAAMRGRVDTLASDVLDALGELAQLREAAGQVPGLIARLDAAETTIA